MTGATTYDQMPKLIRFDRDLCSLSASSIASILDHIARDRQGVHREIVHHAMTSKDKRSKADDAYQHAMLQVVEFAHARPDDLIDLITQQRWRYWFARLCALQFRSQKSSWHYVHVRPDRGDDLSDATTTAPEPSQAEADMTRFLNNLSILFREVPWAEQRLFAIYHFDLHGWLKEEQVTRPKARMTYRLIQARTGIPNQTVCRAIQNVHRYIREHYADRFGEPLPSHLLGEF